MGDNLGPNGLSRGCKVFCSRSKYPAGRAHGTAARQRPCHEAANALALFAGSRPAVTGLITVFDRYLPAFQRSWPDFAAQPSELFFNSLALLLRTFSMSSRSFKSASTDIEPRFVLAISISQKRANIAVFGRGRTGGPKVFTAAMETGRRRVKSLQSVS
jgi:hypothetical protein